MASSPHPSFYVLALLLVIAAAGRQASPTGGTRMQMLGGGAPMDVTRFLMAKQGQLAAGAAGINLANSTVQAAATGSFPLQGKPLLPDQQAESNPDASSSDLLKEVVPPLAARRFLQQFGNQVQDFVNGALQTGLIPPPQSADRSTQALPPATQTAKPVPAPAPKSTPAAAAPVSSTPAPSGQFSEKISGNDPLTLHNGYRAVHQDTSPLSYDTQLEANAQNWANKLASECSFYHSGPGENMASGFNSWGEVMWAFYKEYKDYSYANPAYAATTGHFTQMIWKETNRVGCAVATASCWMGQVHVCHYSPVGNVNAAQYFQQNVAPPK